MKFLKFLLKIFNFRNIWILDVIILERAVFNYGLLDKKEALRIINLAKYGVFTCELCRKPFGRTAKVTIDHVIPKSKGGSNKIENLQLAHYGCNKYKGDKIK